MRPEPKPYVSGVSHPALLLAAKKLAPLKLASVKDNFKAIWELPYPADPLTEPEFEGMTYGQVACMKQMMAAARGDGESLDRVLDRLIGKPMSTNTNINLNKTYADFLDEVAENERKVNQDGVIDADFRSDSTKQE